MYKDLEWETQGLIEMRDKLECRTKETIMNNFIAADTSEVGKMMDMLKDISETIKNYHETEYYASVVRAMHEGFREDDRAGYNPNRYASGRYAPSGHGNMTRGYDGDWTDMYPSIGLLPGHYTETAHHMTDEEMERAAEDVMSKNPEFGRGHSYHKYSTARRYYHETKSAKDKSEMNEHAKKHLMEFMDTVREMYSEAEPDLRRDMKDKLTKLVSELM